jgi:beta-1,2-mannobiose phosphorylase / 1,2-beta-oligomannan phosphorylase
MLILFVLSLILALVTSGLFLYGVVKILRSTYVQKKIEILRSYLTLTRVSINPIISKSTYDWEEQGVLNPAVFVAGGKVHLFYRAIGNDGVSRVGYASSIDGITFTERLPYPVYMLDNDSVHTSLKSEVLKKNPGLVASGGSWVGIEDPRGVVIDGRVYLSFSAFIGWDSLRMGVISISVADLLAKRWKWSRPVFLSGVKEVQKNWVVFPEKIKGKFAILHGFGIGKRDRVLIEYLETLESEPDSYIQSDGAFRSDYQDLVWDSRIRGAGPPPIKTSAGWILLYHANDVKEPDRYKIGAALLSLKDPTKILARSSKPILSPDAHYENDGKPGVVYACGALVRDGILYVYYGGGDMVVCVATIPLHDLLTQLIQHKDITLSTHVVKI